MDKDDLEKLSDEQVVQLHELYQETQKALVDQQGQTNSAMGRIKQISSQSAD